MRKQLEAAVLAAMDQASRDVMQWGKDDCSLWAADVVCSVLGYDPASSYRGRYKTRRGALRVLGRKGLKGAMFNAARRHKWKRIDPTMAQPGDVGLVWTRHEDKVVLSVCICRARDWFVVREEKGFSLVPAYDVAAAWSVLSDWQPGMRVNHRRISTRPDLTPTDAAQHGFVVAIVGAISAAVATVTATAIGTFLFTTALSIGFSLVASLLQPHTGLGSGAGTALNNLGSNVQSSAQVTERQALPVKRVIVGTALVGGALFFEQVKKPFLTHGILLNHGEIDGIESVRIGTDKLVLTDVTENTILVPLGVGGQPDYPNNLRLCIRYGSDDQVIDALIANDFTNVDSSFRQRGIATIVLRYKYPGTTSDDFAKMWGQVQRPSAYTLVRGVKVYDPRDPTQLLSDESTWKWSNNASLIQAWYLTRDFGGRIPVDDIVWDKVADSANYDDDLVGCKDGTLIKRHTIDGVITLNEKPYSVLPKLLSANRGYVLNAAGKWWVQSSRPKKPITTIHDGILAGGIKFQSAKAKRDLINKSQVRFVAEDQGYQTVDGPILDRTDLQTIDKETLLGTLSLEYTRDHRRAQRLNKAYLDSSRLGKTIQVPVDISLLSVLEDELIGNAVNYHSVLAPSMNGTYLVTGVGLSEDYSSLALALTEYDADIETDWDPDTDEQDFTLADVDVS